MRPNTEINRTNRDIKPPIWELNRSNTESRQLVVANRLRRQPLERRGVGQCREVEVGDRRDPVAADRQRGVNPDKAIDQAGTEEGGREPGAALDQEPGDSALAERRERGGE